MAEKNWTNLWGAINVNAEVWDAEPSGFDAGPFGLGAVGIDDGLAARYPIHLPPIRPADGGSGDLEGQDLLDYNLGHKAALTEAGFKVDDVGRLHDNRSANPFDRAGATGGRNIVSTPFGDYDMGVFRDSAWDGIHNVFDPLAGAAGSILKYALIGVAAVASVVILVSIARR